jgi:hypothetical protein
LVDVPGVGQPEYPGWRILEAKIERNKHSVASILFHPGPLRGEVGRLEVSFSRFRLVPTKFEHNCLHATGEVLAEVLFRIL